MKTKTILMLIILATTSFSLAAQTVSEKVVKETTYVVTQNKENVRKEIKNKNGLYDKYSKEKLCPVYVKASNITSKELVGKIFSEERIKKLASTPDTNIPITLICSLSGDVVAVKFYGVNTDLITWDEIKALEDACLKVKYVFDTSKCTDAKYCLIFYNINFSRLL